MPHNRESLLAGRNLAPLTEREISRAISTFIALDTQAPVRHVAGERTRFRVEITENEEVAEIVFGPDLYPGANLLDPNSSLTMQAAAAHELMHLYRWRDKTELIDDSLIEIDEALTSLSAIMHFQKALSDQEVRQLIADAIQRLQAFVQNVQVQSNQTRAG